MTRKARSIVKTTLRIVNLFIVFCLLITPIGCTINQEDSSNSFMDKYQDDSLDAIESPISAKRTPIRILFPGYPPRNWEDVKAKIEKQTRDTLNITLDFKWKEQYSYISEVKTLQASNQVVDALILASPEAYLPDFTKLAQLGSLKDITDIFPESAPVLYRKYTNEELAYASVNSKLYAVPSLYRVSDSPTIIVSDPLMKEFKIDYISDFEQYEAFLKNAKENKPNNVPGIDTATFVKTLPKVYGYAVADEKNMLVYKWDDPKMRLVAWEETPEFSNIVNMYIDWFEKGYLRAVIRQEDYFTASSVLLAGALTPSTDKANKLSVSSTLGTTVETEPVRTCRLYPEKTVQRSNPMGKFGSHGSFIFPKESKNTEVVLQFLEWVQLDRKNYNLMVNGIEGTDYVMKDGKPELPEGMNSLSSSYMYWNGHWAFRNIDYESAEKNIKPLTEYLENNSEYPPHGVLYPEYGVLDQVSEQRSKALQEFYSSLARGQIKTQDQLNDIIKKMNDLGTEEHIITLQSQLTSE